MAEAFVGEIRLFFGTFAPAGWALCEGQLKTIWEHTALFSLLDTYYGGDGKTTFALPDLPDKVLVGTNHEKEISVGVKGEYEPPPLGRGVFARGPRYIIALQGIYPSKGDDTYNRFPPWQPDRPQTHLPQPTIDFSRPAETIYPTGTPEARPTAKREIASARRRVNSSARVAAKRPPKRVMPVPVPKQKDVTRFAQQKPSQRNKSLEKILAKGPVRLAEKLLGIRRVLRLDRRELAISLGPDLNLRSEDIQLYEWALAIPEVGVVERYAEIAHINPKNLIDDTMEGIPAWKFRVKYIPFEEIKKRGWKLPIGIYDASLDLITVEPSRAVTQLSKGLNELVLELTGRKRQVGEPLGRKLSKYRYQVPMICVMSGDKQLYDHIVPILTQLTSTMRADKAVEALEELTRDLNELPALRHAALVSKAPVIDTGRAVKSLAFYKPERIAEKVRSIRERLGLSQQQMLERLGATSMIAPADISKYETGRRDPAPGLLLNYARLSNVELEVLVDDELDLPEVLPSSIRHGGIKHKAKGKRKR
ncbi:MAG: hypothetical protein QOD75_3751 [Blastocatellia bacterium]|jgi:DNA-binding transcriptional regulator YiaG|nr:hypothetical protein [Blastocatellia bacterium]